MYLFLTKLIENAITDEYNIFESRKNGLREKIPGKLRNKNRGVSVEHRGVCVWNVGV